MRKAALSNKALPIRWPLPVFSRSRNAACAATTPKIAPRISMTEAPSPQRSADWAGHEGESGLELDHFVQSRAMFVRPGEVAL